MKKIIIFATLQLFCFTTHAKLFSNSYVSFQLPPNWSCKVTGTEWTCKSSNSEQARQAIIVLTAKEMGPNDNFAYYNQYLKTPRSPKHRDGTVATVSKVQHLKTIQVNNHPWIDGLHFGSLLPNFYSRYLVTIKDKIAVLVTFSAKKEFYVLYSKAFYDAIQSLRITASAGTNRGNLKGSNEALGVDIAGQMEDGDWSEADANGVGLGGAKKKGSNLWIYGLALILAGAGIFFLVKKKSKK
jgi:hypothetical protein